MTTTIFTATDGVHGRELWRTDGTAAGTFMITDLKAGTADGFPAGGSYAFRSAVGNVFFTYGDGTHGSELWATDGSAAGTRLVRDIAPGSAGSSIGAGGLAIGNRLFFSANDGAGGGQELWVSDGTPDGTHLVADLNPAGSASPSNFAAYGGQLYFTANRPTTSTGSFLTGGIGAELFVSDGTAAGTRLVTDFAPGSTSATVGEIGVLNDKLILSYRDNVSSADPAGDYHFAVSDGTALGTTTFTPRTASGGELYLYGSRVVVGNQLYFGATDAAANAAQLWVTDGTLSGTHPVDAAHPINGGIALSGDKLLYDSADAVVGGELFVADSSGSRLLKDINAGTSSSSVSFVGSASGKVYFTATDGLSGTELWSTDGTEAGTQRVTDTLGPLGVRSGAIAGTGILLSYDDAAHGVELWTSDGTRAGTQIVADLNSRLDHRINLHGPFFLGDLVERAVSGGLLFEAYTQERGVEPWISDGTLAGTHQLATNFDLNSGDSYVTSFRAFGTGIAFVRNNALWAADDDHFTNAHRVSPASIGASTSVNALGPSLGATLFFTGYNSAVSPDATAIYVSDGTADGTHILRTDAGRALNGFIDGLTDRVLITPTSGLYASDGTNAGTTQIGVASDTYTYGGRVDDRIFYIENDRSTGAYAVVTTDGTAAGTQRVAALPFTQAISSTLAVGSTRVLADNGHLYRTDGTASGTYQLLAGSTETFTLTLQPTPGEPGTTYFIARTATSPAGALWVTDGTDAGTRVLSEAFGDATLAYLNGQIYYSVRTPSLDLGGLYAANADGTNQHLVSDALSVARLRVAAGKLFIGASDAANGAEIWTSDGTAAGTVRLTDTYTNPGSDPANFVRLLATGEAAIASPQVSLARDTGLSGSDAVTMDATLKVVPAAAGETLSYVVDGAAVSSYDPASLAQGAHTVTVTQTDAAGQVSAPGTISFRLDTTAPVNAVDTPSSETVAGVPTVLEGHGAAEDAGGRIDIVDQGTVLATTTVGGTGAWSTTVQLTEGAHHLVATLTDVAGNTGSASVDITATMPTDPPRTNHAPVAQDDSARTRTDTVLALPAAWLLANDTDADNDALTLIGVGGASHGSVAYDAASGYVTFAPEDGYAGGAGFSYAISDGHGGTASGTVSVSVSAGAPPAITGVSGATNSVIHGLTGTVDPSEAGTVVTVRDGTFVLGTVTSDAEGHFALPFAFHDSGLGHTYALTATDALGATSDPVAFTLDFTPNQGLFGTVVHDASGAGGQIVELYQGLLGRAPDALGFENAVDAVGHGRSLASLAQDFLASPEYTAAHEAIAAETDAGFVSELYRVVLGRAGDASGTAFWTDALAHGTSRADAALSFALSSENLGQDAPMLGSGVFVPDPIASDVARLYYGVLDRAPDVAGLQFWSSAIKGGASETAVAQSFLSSAEYAAAAHGATPTLEALITGLYDGALGRIPDVGDVAFWQSAVDRGVTRADIAIGIAESAEAQTHHAGDIEQGWHLG